MFVALGAAEDDEAIELLEVVGLEEVVEGGCIDDVVGATVVVVVDEATEEDSADDELGMTGANVDKVVEEDGTGAAVVVVGATVVEADDLVVVETTGTVVLDGSSTWALTFNASCNKITTKINSHFIFFCIIILYKLLNYIFVNVYVI